MADLKIDFLGIGAYRSATTWISACLREHPEICIPRIKEIEFFAKKREGGKVLYYNYEKGMDWYKSQFAECRGAKLKGEYSNAYLADEEAPKMIKKHFPSVKLIVCLRNPIDRAYSHYWWDTLNFNQNKGLSFAHFIRPDSEYVQQSLYYKHLQRYFKLFGPRKIQVILVDDIQNHPRKVIRDLYAFLGADPRFSPPSLRQRVNPAARYRFRLLTYAFPLRVLLERMRLGVIIDVLKRIGLYDRLQNFYVAVNRKEVAYPPIGVSDRERLRSIFREDIRNLERLISRDLSFWR